MSYEHTHVSRVDGSPAQLVRVVPASIVLRNEDGYVWTDPADQWVPIDNTNTGGTP
jgi:hypothetical protein